MVRRAWWVLVGLYLLFAAWWVISAGVVRDSGEVELLNVACDPTRELWNDLNERFIESYEREKGERVSIRQSHGGSSSQARAVIDGLDADVVTLALWTDTDAIRRAGRMDEGWENRFRKKSLPFVSTIVMVVRKGNPKAIRDWSDLTRDGVTIVVPNPKTSGNGKWAFLALWGAFSKEHGDEIALEKMTEVFRRVPVRDASARKATMTFAQNKMGDVHLTWENEAYLEMQEANGELEIVYPKRSILAEPHVALVDDVIRRKGTRVQAEAYLNFLYRPEAQEIIASHFYRPNGDEEVKRRTANQFPALELFPASEIGDWDTIQKRFFAEGGLFDQITANGRRP